MILSLALIIAVIMGVNPWVLFALSITWMPDVVLMALISGASS